MDVFDKRNMERNFGPMYTFVWGQYPSNSFKLVLIFKGKKRFSKKQLRGFRDCFNYEYEKIDGFFCMLNMNYFELLFGKKLKSGEVRYGRLKLRFIKRKKKKRKKK